MNSRDQDDVRRVYDARWRKLFAPRTGDLRRDAAAEAADYLGLPMSEALARLDGASERFTDEWKAHVPGTADTGTLTEFYNESETELFDLLEWHATDEGNHRALVCTDQLMRRHPAGAVLDYGSGIGTAGIVLADAGFEVTLADVADPLLDFARWRFARRGLPVRTIDLKRETPRVAAYHGIVCFDVLEHIPRPQRVVRRLRDALVVDGVLFVFAPFGLDPRRPMHVVHDDGVYHRMAAMGLARQGPWEDEFPPYMWGARPNIYARVEAPAWKRAAYYTRDVLLPDRAADVLTSALRRVRT